MTDLLLNSTNIPTQFQKTHFCDFDTKRRSCNSKILHVVDDWNPTDEMPGIVFEGAPALGKTMLASALLNEYHADYNISAARYGHSAEIALQKKCPVYFIPLAAYIEIRLRMIKMEREVDKGLREPGPYLDLDQLLEDLYYRVKVLVIDDVGKEHRTNSGYATDLFDLLVRTRHNAGLTTIYTTNVPVRKWDCLYSESMKSLIRRSSVIVDF